jgi:hypothetical protein
MSTYFSKTLQYKILWKSFGVCRVILMRAEGGMYLVDLNTFYETGIRGYFPGGRAARA